MHEHGTPASPVDSNSDPGVRRRLDVLWRIAPGYLVLSTVSGEALAATGPAPDIWGLLNGWTTIDLISGELADRHDADLDQVRPDVAAFVDRLIEAGCVERAGGSDG